GRRTCVLSTPSNHAKNCSTTAAQCFPHHSLCPGDGEGESDFVLVAVDGPEIAGLQLALAFMAGLEGRLIHGEHVAVQNRGPSGKMPSPSHCPAARGGGTPSINWLPFCSPSWHRRYHFLKVLSVSCSRRQNSATFSPLRAKRSHSV